MNQDKNNNPVTGNRLAWRLDEIAKETGLSVQFLRKEIRNKNLKATRLGRCVLVTSRDLNSYLHANREEQRPYH